jgi:hypothetical protein
MNKQFIQHAANLWRLKTESRRENKARAEEKTEQGRKAATTISGD